MNNTQISDQDFISAASFQIPNMLVKSAWLQHAPFAFWLASVHKPSIFVELGCHHGFSYFSFCQAVKNYGLDTKCYAVDTWKGDEHAGFYQEDVFENVEKYNSRHYASFSSLIRTSFDEAKKHFSDGSIDLLHIDGCHTYEAVKHDFETWKPKLSENSVVCFHDTNVRERNFGVYKFWEELTNEFPHFEFKHGYGLGVIGIGEHLAPELLQLFSASKDIKLKSDICNIYFQLGSSIEDKFHLSQIEETNGTEENEHEVISVSPGKVNELQDKLIDYENIIDRHESKIQFLRSEINEQFEEIQSLNSGLVEKRKNEVSDADLQNSETQKQLVNANKRIQNLQHQLNRSNRELQVFENSSRRLLLALYDKIIHAPRDISRRVRKSISKARKKPSSTLPENKLYIEQENFQERESVPTIKQSHREAKQAVKLANQSNRSQAWVVALTLWQDILKEYSHLEMFLNISKMNISVIKRIIKIDEYKNEIFKYNEKLKCKKYEKRIVVYSAIIDNYDTLKLPEKLDNRFEYVVYTNTALPETDIFQVRPITFFQSDATRAARFIKTHPHILFNDYDIAIWVDANILITGEIYELVEGFLKSNHLIAAIPHPQRRDIYEEFGACVQREKDEPDIMQKQCEIYHNENFRHDDLIESNFMMFKLKNEIIKEFFTTWWNQINHHSKRDQLSLNYSMQQHKLEWYRLTKYPVSIRNHPSFSIIPHNNFDSSAISALFSQLQVKSKNPYQGNSYFEYKRPRLEKQQSCSIDIIVPVHNALRDVQNCLESICKARKNEQQSLILIDDGSDVPTADYLNFFVKGKSWVKLHRNVSATGYTKAANKGMSLSEGEFVIVLNSDTIVTENWAEKLADAVFSTPKAGLVGPMSNAATYQSLPDIKSKNGQTAVNDLPEGVTVEDMNELCECWTPHHIIPMVPLVHGFCFGITRELINSIGLFDEVNFPRGYGEENDYCLRAADAGYNLVVATHTYVFHAKSKSYGKVKRKELTKAGNDSLRRLHGVERIKRAEIALRNNQILEEMRKKAKLVVNSHKYGENLKEKIRKCQ